MEAAKLNSRGSMMIPGIYTASANKWNHFLIHNEDGLWKEKYMHINPFLTEKSKRNILNIVKLYCNNYS